MTKNRFGDFFHPIFAVDLVYDFMISVNNVSVVFGGFYLLDSVSFLINKKDRIGLTGRNGAGKSTTLKMLAGLQMPSEGNISMASDIKIGYLPQTKVYTDGNTVRKEAEKAFADLFALKDEVERLNLELAGREDYESEAYMKLLDKIHEKTELLAIRGENNIDREVEVVLKGLGFKPEDLDRNCEEFSGGWRMRIELAKILLARPDIFLLDEPTNHLDIESISWLESFLQTYSGAVVLVSHDRAFLDNVTTRTLEISLGKVYDYKVAYSQFEQLHKERIEQQMRAYQNQQKQIKDTEDFIERFRYKATKSVQVQSRIKQLEKLERIEVEEEDMARITVRFQPAVRSGEIVLTGKELTKAYGDHVVLKGIQLDIKRGEKIAFVGKNGEGKSTLVKMIMNEIPFEGELKIGHHVNIGYFAQNQADLLDPEVSVLDTVDRVAEGEIRKKIRDILGAFLFSGEEVDKKVKVLSGGERTRLAMVRLLLEPYNLLILDEPTNHLDMRTKDILKEALRKFEGTVIVVSHDRDFLTGLADKVYEFANQHIKEYLGGITDFLAAKKIACFREYEQLHKPKGNGISNDEAEREVSENKLSFEERKQLNKEIRKAEQRVERAEQRVTELESEVAALEKQMAAGVVNDELLKKYGETQKELEEAMEEVLDIVVMGRACRNTANIKNRQPIGTMFVKAGNTLSDFYKEIVEDELNVKKVVFTDDVRDFTTYTFKPQLRTVGPKYGKQLGGIQKTLAALDGNAAMDELNASGSLSFDVNGVEVSLTKEDLLIEMTQKEGYVSEVDNNMTVVLDTNLSDELIEEGFVFEIISKIQTMRKEAGFEVMDHIRVSLCGNETVAGIASSNQEFIAGKVLADSITAGDMLAVSKEWNVNGENVTIAIEKVN